MTRRKPEQIVRLLRKADEELAKGKSVQDFCREEQVSAATPRPQQAEYPSHVWTYDILFDHLADGRPFTFALAGGTREMLIVLDEFTRECVGFLAATSILAEDVISFVDEIMLQRSSPVFLRSDNGSEFTAEAVQIWLVKKSVGLAFIPPGSLGRTTSSKVSMTSFGMKVYSVNGSLLCWMPRL